MTNKNPPELRATAEDYLRGAGYLMFIIWPASLLMFPPKNFFSAFGDELLPRIIWLGLTMVAAAVAAVGAFRRYDLKVELPGILGIQLGPLLFSVSNWWYIAFPDDLNPDPTNRVALAIFALIPCIMLLPRTFALFKEARRLKRLNRQSVDTAHDLLMAKADTAENRVAIIKEATRK